MDVISTIRPENHITRARTQAGPLSRDKPPVSREGYRKDRALNALSGAIPFRKPLIDPVFRSERTSSPGRVFPSFALARENPASFSFPLLMILAMSVLVSLAPVFEHRFGLYRLDRMDFPSDSSNESAMRLLVTPEPDASLLAASADSQLPAIIRSVSYSTWRVRSGDTLGGILSRFGLRNMSTILSFNGITNARRLTVGQTLTIPSMDGLVHTVVRGDSLGRIASRYAVPVTAILDANDLSASTVIAGQRLFIPGASLSPTELRRAMGELFVYPVKGRLTSRFGWRPDPFTGVRTFHTGIDLAAPIGTPVKATLDGRIATTGFSSVFGNYIIISHDAGFQTLYGHLSAIGVSRGQYVAQGAIIGKVGNTGYSTGSHLHLSLYKNGKMMDPLSVLN
jgi:murein DD-endopeptidase MepM/ murein hydrolase activator NlpD